MAFLATQVCISKKISKVFQIMLPQKFRLLKILSLEGFEKFRYVSVWVWTKRQLAIFFFFCDMNLYALSNNRDYWLKIELFLS